MCHQGPNGVAWVHVDNVSAFKEAREVAELRGLLVGGAPSNRGRARAPPSARGQASSRSGEIAPDRSSLTQKVSRIKAELELDPSLRMLVAISQANEKMGMTSQNALPLPDQALLITTYYALLTT